MSENSADLDDILHALTRVPTEYVVVWGNTIEDLEQKVRKNLKDDWHLQGGVQAANLYYQAMVKF